jgi:hypothetical protein
MNMYWYRIDEYLLSKILLEFNQCHLRADNMRTLDGTVCIMYVTQQCIDLVGKFVEF